MPNNKDRAHRFWKALGDWSQATFGLDKDRGPIGPLKHLIKEVNETLLEIERYSNTQSEEHLEKMKEEFADCLFLVFDATRRAGFTYNELLYAAFKKLEKNKRRVWNKPTSDEPVEHIRTEELDNKEIPDYKNIKI